MYVPSSGNYPTLNTPGPTWRGHGVCALLERRHGVCALLERRHGVCALLERRHGATLAELILSATLQRETWTARSLSASMITRKR
jgi:hypothetical protein